MPFSPSSIPKPDRAAGPVRAVLGVILIAAAGLKAHQLATEPLAARAGVEWAARVGLVGLELGLGVWFVSGRYPRVAWWAAILLYGGFALVSFANGLRGRASCGCFGKLIVSPWVTGWFDTIAIAVMIWARLPLRRWDYRWKYTPGVLVSICAVVAMSRPLTSVASLSWIAHAKGIGLPAQETWVGTRFPLAGQVEDGGVLESGNWVVVLVHSTCGRCQKVIPMYQQLAHGHKGTRVAIVEVDGGGKRLEAAGLSDCHHTRLISGSENFFQTPTEILLSDGVVTGVSTDLAFLRSASGVE